MLNSSESTMILSQQLSSFLVERIHQRGSVGELIDGGVMRGEGWCDEKAAGATRS